MDPRAAVAEARQLGLQPPPRRPAPAKAAPADDAPPQKRQPRRQPAARSEKPRSAPDVELPGFSRGNRRALTVSLPRVTLAALREASRDSSMGATVVEALRASYAWLVETHKPKPEEAVGPFPIPVRPRRRRQVEDPTPVHLYMSPAEAAAVAQVAEECELSISELVTIGLDHHLSPPAGAPKPARKRPAKSTP